MLPFTPQLLLRQRKPVVSGAPTPIILLDPNDIGTGNWTRINGITTQPTQADPSGGTTGVAGVAGSTGSSELAYQSAGTVTGGVTYSLKWSARALLGSVWMSAIFHDGTNILQVWVNTSTGAIGTQSITGTLANTSASSVAFTNSFWTFTITAAFPGTASGTAGFELDDADNVHTATSNQQIILWGMGT